MTELITEEKLCKRFYTETSRASTDVRSNSDSYDTSRRVCSKNELIEEPKETLVCEKCNFPFGFHDLKCGVEDVVTDEDDTDEVDDEPDIVESSEMTIETEEAIHVLFKGVDDRADKIKIDVQENGGAVVFFRGYKLIIYPTGLRFALRTPKNEIHFFRENAGKESGTREDLVQIINAVLNVDSRENQRDYIKEAKNVTIKLKKGFDKIQMRKFIQEVDDFLFSRKGIPTNVHVTTEDWKGKDPNPFMVIPAAKKMFSKFCEMGLLASLVLHGFMEAAKNVYCVAYVKGRMKNEGVEFKNVDVEDFKAKLFLSATNLRLDENKED